MSILHFPWLETGVLVPLCAAIWVRLLRDPDAAWRISLVAAGATGLCALGAWADFATIEDLAAHDRWDFLSQLTGTATFEIDSLSAPLLPQAALLYFLTVLATLRTKLGKFSFSSLLVSESLLLATLSCKQPWLIVGLLALGTLPPWIELRVRRQPTRIYLLHMGLFVGLLISGQWLMVHAEAGQTPVVAVVLLMTASLVRSGIFPMHCWMTDLFARGSFGSALLFVTPMVGAYLAIRLVVPFAPDWVLRCGALASLVTAIYAAGMALVQSEARRFFCFLFLSHSSLVFVGMEMATAIGLTGSLCVWLSVALSMTGFGLTLRSIEARAGTLSLDIFHGLHDTTPRLAGLFLLTGLASIGFPGTVGFVGTEMLIDGAVHDYLLVGIAIVIVGALNGLAVLQIYFRVFGGPRHVTSIDLRSRPVERIAVLLLTTLILGGGLFPQPSVTSRYDAARRIIAQRSQLFGDEMQFPTAQSANSDPQQEPNQEGIIQNGASGHSAYSLSSELDWIMNTIDYIYRFDPDNPSAKPLPHDADAARKILEDGNRMFSRWMESCRIRTASEGEPLYIVPCNGLEVGMPRTQGSMPKQTPFAVVVGCSDARVPTEMLFGQGFNDLFVIRVAGNVLGDVCLGSVDFALNALSDSVRVVVMLGHSGCGAVSAAVDAYLKPRKFWSRSLSPMLRSIIQRIFVAVREAANGLKDVWGPEARNMPGYREALIEIAVCINAAQSAFDLRQEVERNGKWEIEVLYGVHNIRNHQVCMPVAPNAQRCDENVRLAHAPANPSDFHVLAMQMATLLLQTEQQVSNS